MWYSNPQIGTVHDIKMFQNVKPPLNENESLLADKAYVADKFKSPSICPIKKPRDAELNDRQQAYNLIHRWYRASVEHSIGYLKRYKILSSTYR
jgi:hypothetical protein